MTDSRIGIVVITHKRRAEALDAVARLTALPEQPPVVLVDNGSADGTANAVRQKFPQVEVVALTRNEGAAGRNLGVERLHTPYVAFCDDDTWWEPGSLTEAADVFDAHPRLGVVNARIVVEPGGRDDPIVAELRDSPVPGPDWLPGPALGSFLAGASVVRRQAFEAVGGFSSRLWLGGEEELLATDLLSAGWELCYLERLVVHHAASPARDATRRRRDGLRNTLWFTWLPRRYAVPPSWPSPCPGTASRRWPGGMPSAGCPGCSLTGAAGPRRWRRAWRRSTPLSGLPRPAGTSEG